MRAARFLCAVELLAEVLHLPDGARVIGVAMSPDMRCVSFTIDDPSLPEADDPHDAAPIYTREIIHFDWNVT